MQGKKPIKKQSQQEKNFLTPQGHGDGHEIRAQSLLAKKRPPVSSARKFNARIPKDETLVHKLEESLKETHCQDAETTISRKTSHDQKLKAASVAEITPTKSNKRSCNVSLETGYEVYATPRLHIPVKIYCRQEKYICIVYKRLVLLAWRRSRAYISSMQEQLEKQRQQIAQLGLQTNTLGILRTSESQKRMQNHAEYQQLKRTVELFELENGRLNEVLENMQSQMETLQNNLKIAKTENSVLSDEANEMRDIICKKNSEEKILEERIKRQEEIVSAQNVYLGDLKDKMMELDSELKKCKVNCYVKERKYAKLKCEFKKQLDANANVSQQFALLENEKLDSFVKVDSLEIQLNHYICQCESLREINTKLANQIQEILQELNEEKKHNWIRNSKRFALLSLAALQKMAHVVVPVYLKINNTNF